MLYLVSKTPRTVKQTLDNFNVGQGSTSEVDSDEAFQSFAGDVGPNTGDPTDVLQPARTRSLPWTSVSALVTAAACFALGLWLHDWILPNGLKATGLAIPNVAANGQFVASGVLPAPMPTITVDVHGDVHHPGVYQLPANSRMQDAINKAGGYLHAVDAEAVNAAAPLDDGAEVVVAKVQPPGNSELQAPGELMSGTSQAGGPSQPGALASEGAPASSSRIDINTATAATLETLPSIGPGRAAAILAYRAQHGRFMALTDLRHVHGIGVKTFARISPYLYVSDGARH